MTLAIAVALLMGVQPAARTGRTGTGIAYDVQGTGTAVVLITGSNLDRRMWAAEAAWLSERFTVVRYDLRAHGESALPERPFSHTGDLFALLDELRIEKAALVGLSAGSTIALDAALQAPQRVTQMVLVAPAISGYMPKERPEFFGPLMAALQARDYTKAQEVLIASPLFAVPEESRALVRTMVTENNRLWTVPRELMTAAPPAAAKLDAVTTPALVVVGDRDLAAQREQAELLGKQLRGARLVVVAGGGHLLNLTSAAEFKSLVTAFLTSGRP